MASLRIWIILSWIALPTVMFGGYSLLRLLNRGDALTPFQVDCFRAGHAHAGVLLLMALLYYIFLDRTTLPASVKQAACVALFVGILAQHGPGRHRAVSCVIPIHAASRLGIVRHRQKHITRSG
jgi:hypothetical protein